MNKIVLWTLMAGVALSACSGSTGPPRTTSSDQATSSSSGIPLTTVVGQQTTQLSMELSVGGPALPDAPSVVAEREPLPYCGAEFDNALGSPNPYDDIEVVGGARACYHQRASAGQPAELVMLAVTIEGDPIMQIRRLLPDGREVIFWDATQDNFGAMAWVMIECDTYTGPDQNQGVCTEVVLNS